MLGDSFTNVFSLEPMGWGTSAGLAPQLARALGRDVDVIARNDAGAHATRRMLLDALAGGEDRLAGKTVVDLGAGLARARRRRLQADRLVGAGAGRGGPRDEGPVLVTGAAGEVGRGSCGGWRATAGGCAALVLPGDPLRARLEGTGCEIVEGDVRDAATLGAAVRRRRGGPIIWPRSSWRAIRRLRRDQPPRHRQHGRRRRGRGRAPLRVRLVGVGGVPAPHALRASQAGGRGDRAARAPARPHHRAADAGLRRDAAARSS